MGTGRQRRRTVVLCGDDVVDDETLHPGAVVWLGKPALSPDELARYVGADVVAAMAADGPRRVHESRG